VFINKIETSQNLWDKEGDTATMEEHIIFNTEDVRNNKVYGILAYIGILFLVPMLAAKDSQYARFHANQGFVLFISEVLLNIVGRVIVFVIGIGTLGLLTNFASILVNLIVSAISIVYLVIGILNACSGEPKTLPIIGGITILQ
jgi:uncharacterized membrane protein